MEAEIYLRAQELQDVNKQLRAEQVLRESEERLRQIVETALDAVITMNAEGIITEWNAQAEAIFGWSREEAIGRELADTIIPPALRESHRRGLRHFLATGVGPVLNRRIEMTALHRSGREFPVELAIAPAKIGDTFTFSGFVRDLTERKRLEEQLLQAQKLESVSRLAGGVAHDFNNLLTVITGHAELAAMGLPAESLVLSNVQSIQLAAERAANLTRQLLAFARKQVIEPKVVNLNDLTQNMNKMLRRLIGEDIELVTLLEPSLGRVKVDPSLMEQVIVNLVVNARDAMPDGGKLTIQTDNVTLDEESTRVTMFPSRPAST